MGTVYLAEHVRTTHRVALKVIAPHLAMIPNVARRFTEEARVLMRIDHPNVIRIYDFGSLPNGTLYQVMELLEGCELTAVLERRRKLSAWEAQPYVEQICYGLQAAHDQAVVHRDLKPENVFVVREQPLLLKLFDFGIAKLMDPNEWLNLTVTGVAIGTPMFISPEQAMGDKARIGPHTDIYSLGVILYMMLCGEPPFASETIGVLLARHIQDPPPPLLEREPSVPAVVARLVHRCLEKEPELRPASPLELARAYTAALATVDPGPAPRSRPAPGGPDLEPTVARRPPRRPSVEPEPEPTLPRRPARRHVAPSGEAPAAAHRPARRHVAPSAEPVEPEPEPAARPRRRVEPAAKPAAEPGDADDQRATIVDPRYQRRPRRGAIQPVPAGPSLLGGPTQAAPRRTAAHGLALLAAGLGVLLIVLLVVWAALLLSQP
jgi:serine/threonine protein kinase